MEDKTDMDDNGDLSSLVEPPKQRWRTWTVLVVGIGFLAIIAYFGYQLFLRPETPPDTTSTIKEVPAKRGDLRNILVTTGSAAASKQSNLVFKTGGQVVTVSVSLGDSVRPGQSLAKLDDSNAQRNLAIAHTNLEQARTRLKEAMEPASKSEIASAAHTVATAKAQLASAQLTLANLVNPPTLKTTIAAADASVEQAKLTLDNLENPMSEAEHKAAEVSVEQAQGALDAARRQITPTLATLVDALIVYCDGRTALSLICTHPKIPLKQEQITILTQTLITSIELASAIQWNLSPLLTANSAYINATESEALAQESLEAAKLHLTHLKQVPTPQQLKQAKASLNAALSHRTDLDKSPTASEVDQAKAAVAAAKAGLESALANEQVVKQGTSEFELTLEKQNLRLAELSLQAAQDLLKDSNMAPPYSGVILSKNIIVGDTVTAGQTVFVLMDPNSLGVELNVSESDLPGLTKGQLAIAQFDSMQDQSYLLQITGIDRNPTVTSGVVTYSVMSRLANSTQLEHRQTEVEVLTGLLKGANLAEAGGVNRGSTSRLSAARECAQEVLGRVPTSPEDITSKDRQLIQEKCFGGGDQVQRRQQGTPNQSPLRSIDKMPAPGMNANVSVLISIKPDVLLVPSAAVRRDGKTTFVVVPTANKGIERQNITTGGTDGEFVEVLTGLKEDQIVLMGAGLSVLLSKSNNLQPVRKPQ